MTLQRVGWGAAVLVMAVAAMLLVPAAARAEGAVTLAGTTVVSTSQSVHLEVTVPEGATVDLGGIAVDGDGAWAGLMLRRIDDPDAFSMSAMRYPGGHTSRLVMLAAAEEEPTPTDALLFPSRVTRSCVAACPVPAGTYTLMAVARGGPATLTLTLDGVSGALDLDGATLPRLANWAVDGSERPIERTWDSTASSGGGGAMHALFGDSRDAIAFQRVATTVHADVVGRLSIEFCATSDYRCQGSTSFQEFVPNGVEGEEGLTSYSSDNNLEAGTHGTELRYDYDHAGPGGFTTVIDALFVYPARHDVLGVGHLVNGIIFSPGEDLKVVYDNFGTLPVAVAEVKLEQLVGTEWVPAGQLCEQHACTSAAPERLAPGEGFTTTTTTDRLTLGDHRLVWTFVDDSPAAQKLPEAQRDRTVEIVDFFMYL